MQRKLASALLVALAFGMVACGSASKPLTAAQLRTRGNAICRDMQRRVMALEARSTQATLRASLARAADVLSDGVDRLNALTPPKQLAGRYASLIAWEGARRGAARTLSHGGRPSGRQAAAVRAHHNPVYRIGHELGLAACA